MVSYDKVVSRKGWLDVICGVTIKLVQGGPGRYFRRGHGQSVAGSWLWRSRLQPHNGWISPRRSVGVYEPIINGPASEPRKRSWRGRSDPKMHEMGQYSINSSAVSFPTHGGRVV